MSSINPKSKKLLAALAILLVLFSSFSFIETANGERPLPSDAQLLSRLPEKDDFCGTFFNSLKPRCIVFHVLYMLRTLLMFLVNLGIYLTMIALNLSYGVASLSVVTKGFEVSLAVVNLVFVFLIIFMAIATILRSQTYGLKRAFLKLILAVILVNFSLVAAKIMLNFSNGAALFFISAASDNQGSEFNKAAAGFGKALMGVFNPQSVDRPPTAQELAEDRNDEDFIWAIN
ncbi:MAG: hypothetical protein ACK4NX_01520, partial [Candidatus Paceibacteria bacterium]